MEKPSTGLAHKQHQLLVVTKACMLLYRPRQVRPYPATGCAILHTIVRSSLSGLRWVAVPFQLFKVLLVSTC